MAVQTVAACWKQLGSAAACMSPMGFQWCEQLGTTLGIPGVPWGWMWGRSGGGIAVLMGWRCACCCWGLHAAQPMAALFFPLLALTLSRFLCLAPVLLR